MLNLYMMVYIDDAKQWKRVCVCVYEMQSRYFDILIEIRHNDAYMSTKLEHSAENKIQIYLNVMDKN